MISDVCIINTIEKEGKIPLFDSVEYDSYDEFWSFWSLENPYQENSKRLRYHLGHSLMAKKMKDLLHNNKKIKPIICDFQKGTGNWDAVQELYLEKTKDVVSRFVNDPTAENIIKIEPSCISEYVAEIKTEKLKDTYNRIVSRTPALMEPIKKAYRELAPNYENFYYLYKYRDLSIPGLLFVPQKLASIYKSFPYGEKVISPYIFFASLYALHQSAHSDTDFIDSFWVKTGFPLLACIQKNGEKKREICIVEGKRSAYIWLFLDYLRYMYAFMFPEDKDDIDWPTIVYLDSLPAIHGASYMESGFPAEAIFIDATKKETKKKLTNIPDPIRREYFARCLETGMNPSREGWEDAFIGHWMQQNAMICPRPPKKSFSKRLLPYLKIWIRTSKPGKAALETIDEYSKNDPSK
ncbi:hypothetical protein [Desulfobacula sp.]|uniref:hypothetical protein n=1 Tax=Desulfobacula sp. TaxID=2593537 RepID=UPI0026031B05|nr:hypothetical protein [Desulfobacula sp.]